MSIRNLGLTTLIFSKNIVSRFHIFNTPFYIEVRIKEDLKLWSEFQNQT